MKNSITDYNIQRCENGFIVNKSTSTEDTNGESFSSTYETQTFVFQKWADVLDWLKSAEEETE